LNLRAALSGASLDQILALLQRMIQVTRMVQTADTLKYLYMGGHIGLAKRLMGTMLNIKPLIGMKDGAIVALDIAHSHMQAYNQMAAYVSAGSPYRPRHSWAVFLSGGRTLKHMKFIIVVMLIKRGKSS